ncbi:helix-turn-helix transcriptional regulator [Apilactobacillus ozensis]|nr:helix-turn-helix transcriptional regulator [Apilactobacillus ozensis]
MEFKDKLKLLREKRNYTQSELANKLGTYRIKVSSWENGNSYPDIKMIVKICDYFNISIDDILNEDKKIIEKFKNDKKKIKLYSYITIISLFVMLTSFVLIYNSMITGINANEIKVIKVKKIPVIIHKKIYNKIRTEKDYKYYVYVKFNSAFRTFAANIPSMQCDSYKRYTTASFKAKHSLNIFKNLKQNKRIQKLEIPTYAEDEEGSLNKGKNICIVTNENKPQKKYIILPSNKNN